MVSLHLSSHGIGRDAKELSHFPLGLAGIEQLMGMGDLLGSEGPGAAHMLAALAGGFHSSLHPLADQISLNSRGEVIAWSHRFHS